MYLSTCTTVLCSERQEMLQNVKKDILFAQVYNVDILNLFLFALLLSLEKKEKNQQNDDKNARANLFLNGI